MLFCSPWVVAELSVNGQWQVFNSSDGSNLSRRHEAAGVVVGDFIYLLGGRSNRPVERYSVVTEQWENLGAAPMELHHMQPVAIDDKIYVLGAFSCCYPNEELVSQIYVFDTESATWDVVGSIPEDRLRGSAGAAVYDGKIYLLGGNTLGHNGGAVSWFDEFDPASGEWRVLPDAPNARDHFAAIIIDNQLIAAAGRQTRLPSPAANPVLPTDVYDFDTNQWRQGADIPTVRAGTVAVGYDNHVLVAGGEINTSSDALNVVEAYDPTEDSWQRLPDMTTGRHGAGGGIIGSRFYLLSGAITIGGATESETSEFIQLPAVREIPDPIEVPGEGETPGTPGTGTPIDGEDPIETPSRSGGGALGVMLLAGLLGFKMGRLVWRRRKTGLRN